MSIPNQTATDFIIDARYILPVSSSGEDNLLENYSLVVVAGKILDLLPTDDVADQYAELPRVALKHHLVTPGLVNAHTHSPMNLLRGYADDLPLSTWLEQHIWPAEARWVDEEFVRDGSRLAMAEMIKGGVTCFSDMYFFPEITATTAVEVGIRAMLGMIVVEFPSAWAAGADEYFSKGLALADQIKGIDTLHAALAPHAPYTVGDDSLARIAILSAELDLPVHIHLHETANEIVESTQQYDQRPLARLDRLGLVNNQLMAVHMTQLLDQEIALLAARGSHVIHCPESNMKLASGFCPVADLLAHGVNVAIGTDSAASNNDLDMLSEMRTAALVAKAVSGNAAAVNAAQALRMATLNGAKAMGIDDITGSLDLGKSADIVAFDLDSIECAPLYHPASQLVYAMDRHRVSDVWVAGKRVLEQRELVTIDEQELMHRAQQWQKKIGE